MSIPINSPGPLAFIPPVVAPIAANNIVPLAIGAGAGVAGLSAVIAGAPLAAGVALGFGLVAGAELLFPRPLGDQNPQGWGTQNGPERSIQQTLPTLLTGKITGTYSPTGLTIATFSGSYPAKTAVFPYTNCPDTTLSMSGGTINIFPGITGVETNSTGSGACGGTFSSVNWGFRKAGGSFQTIGFASSSGGITGVNLNLSLSSTAADAQPVENNLIPTSIKPWLGVASAFAELPTEIPAPLPLPAYVPLPATVPAVPDAEPVTQPQPATPAQPPQRIAPPVTVPSSPPWISPSQPGSTPGSVPGYFPSQNPTQPTQPTAPDGTVTPTQPGPITQTQPGSIVPWPGAPSIPAIGPAPRADLVGIAQEVGRIERKLDLMNTPTSPGNLIDLLGEARRLAEAIYELLTSLSAGTTYTLDSPCEVDDEGVKLPPIEIQAAGATSAFGVLMNRTDALAELIQAHKNLKQPGCKHKLAGEIVTVNFQQIE